MGDCIDIAPHVLHIGDCIDVMRGMPDASVDAVVTDPPYFKVLDDDWDHEWQDAPAFLAWLGSVADEWRRVLRPNGSLLCFCSPQMAARVELCLGERFKVLNHIVWDKINGPHGRQNLEAQRLFFPAGERAIFCEQYGADNVARGLAGYAAKCEELRGFVFEPLRAYLAAERDRAGWTTAKVNTAWQAKHGGGGGMAGHWFGQSQWQLPTAAHYDWLRELFNRAPGCGEFLRREYEELRREYEELRREYEELRREYEELRRPFALAPGRPRTDVWRYHVTTGKRHPAEKPAGMLADFLETATRPGAVVLDSFAGSGSTGEACHRTGRRAILIEREPTYAAIAAARIRAAMAQPDLFTSAEEPAE